MSLSLPIALDAMGGDHAPASVVEGARLAHVRYPELRFSFFGDTSKIAPLLDRHASLKAASTIIHTDSAVQSHDKPGAALRQGKNSSMRLAIDAVRDGQALGAVSAGNTGALMAIAKVVLKTLPGIFRPAIAGVLPTMKGECVMLDLGANVECDGETLFQFAVMGDAFARVVLGKPSPTIGILNVGSEDVKGHEEVKAASAMIKTCGLPLAFHGFVEGNHIAEGTVDVVVTDGFSGNIALKTAEGTAHLISHYLRRAFKRNPFTLLCYLFALPALNRVRKELDPRKHNGAMFLGLNGIVVKSHGSADGFSFSNAIGVAVELATHEINRQIIDEIQLSEPDPSLSAEAAEI